MRALEAALGLVALVGLFTWFRRLILDDRAIVLALFLLGLLVVETVLYDPIDVPYGLFHLHAGGFQFRTLDLLILLAIVARLTTRVSRPLDATTFAWVLFGVWLTYEAVAGIRNGNPSSYVQYEYKTVLYLGVAYAAGTARLDRPQDQAAVRAFLTMCGGLAGLLLVTRLGHVDVAVHLPGLTGAAFGGISAISSTLFPMLGVFALATFLCTEPARYSLLVSALILFGTAVSPGQRASPLDLSVSLVAFLLITPFGFRHLRVTPVQFGIGALSVIFALGFAWFTRAAVTGVTSIPFSAQVNVILNGHVKHLSAEDRINQLKVARGLIGQHPIIGWGLGKTFEYYEVGLKQLIPTYLSHNILTDLLVRTGVVGLVLFLAAFSLTLNDGLRMWRSGSITPGEAAVALATISILAGWFAHGMVESLFEHVRLTPAAFLFVGLLRGVLRRQNAMAREAQAERVPPLRGSLLPARQGWGMAGNGSQLQEWAPGPPY
jgi:O-antigen ligase